jgi:1-acyl-sn-glycerol-3-phosphate acyltransferase
MNEIKPFYQGTSYATPARQPGALTRLMPSLSFYLRILGVVWRANRHVARGGYDSVAWHDSSVETVHVLEASGCRLQVEGLEQLQGIDRPCIFIGNHMSTLETFVLPSLIMPQGFDLTYVIKRSLTEYPLFGPVVNSRDPVVVERSNPREDLRAVMQGGLERLANGRSIIIFPQSTRSVDFEPKHFNSIAVKLAKKAGVPVVPVALLTWAWSAGKVIKDFGPIIPSRTIHFAFGAPLEIGGNGQAEHQQVSDFIASHLKRWRDSDR